MRSVRIAAAAGIVATGLALGAAGIASAATPNTAPAPAPAQAKAVPAPAHSKAPARTKAANTTAAAHAKAAPLRVVKISPTKAKAIAEARAEHAKAKAAASRGTTARANYLVTASHLNVRTGPGTKFRVVGTLAKGAHVVAGTKTVNGFRQLSDGHWVSAHYLKATR
jgi:uncharacterized protein YgiM (DUF1202 family)